MLRMTQLTGFGGAAPVPAQITSASAVTVTGGQTMSFSVTTDLSCTLTIGGTDASLVELVSNTDATAHTLRWTGNTTRSHDDPVDANQDNVYSVTITPVRGGIPGHSQNLAITVDLDWISTWLATITSGGGISSVAGETWRILMPAADLSTNGKQLRARLKGGTSGFTIDHLYIGKKAASGDAYDMAASSPAPTQLLKGGVGSMSSTGIFDDVITDTLTFDFDETQSYVVGAHFTAGGTLAGAAPGSITGLYARKAGVDEAGTADVTGYTVQSNSSALVAEVQVLQWIASTSQTLGTDSSGWSGFTLRQVISGASLLSQSGSKVRLTLQAASSAGFSIDAMYIGEQAAAGDAYDMAASPTPAQFLKNGSGSFSCAVGKTMITDSLSFAIDKTKTYVITMHFSGTSSIAIADSITGATRASKSGVNEASTTDVTGYTTVAGQLALIKKIHVAL